MNWQSGVSCLVQVTERSQDYIAIYTHQPDTGIAAEISFEGLMTKLQAIEYSSAVFFIPVYLVR